jgi:MerR family transcriptional regulator, light-induced transcriptional regulator
MSLSANLSRSNIADSYLQTLLGGDRQQARQVIEDCLNCGVSPADILNKLVWPVMESIQQLYKDDQISKAGLNFATRLNRMVADQMAGKLEYAKPNGKKVMIFCGDDEPEELGGQICADLFDASGYEVRFAGGGVPNDEVLALIGEYRPQLLILFATRPAGVPGVRKLIDYLREVNSNPDMQVMCCGGIYKRAEGLAEEIGADLYAPDAADAVRIVSDNPMQRASLDQQTVGRTRRIRKAAQRRSVDTEAA